MKDNLGDRMKRYEASTNILLPRRTNTIIRVDGKAFHTFTKGLYKPYDDRLAMCLEWATEDVAKNMQGCVLAYRQSDEVSFLLQDYNDIKTDAWFDGKVQKMVSVVASMFTAYFNQHWGTGTTDKPAMFDARAFVIPDNTEVANYFLWRNQDAYRNALSMYFQQKEGHKWCQNRSTKELAGILDREEYESLPDTYWNGAVYVPIMDAERVPKPRFLWWDLWVKQALPGRTIGSPLHSE